MSKKEKLETVFENIPEDYSDWDSEDEEEDEDDKGGKELYYDDFFRDKDSYTPEEEAKRLKLFLDGKDMYTQKKRSFKGLEDESNNNSKNKRPKFENDVEGSDISDNDDFFGANDGRKQKKQVHFEEDDDDEEEGEEGEEDGEGEDEDEEGEDEEGELDDFNEEDGQDDEEQQDDKKKFGKDYGNEVTLEQYEHWEQASSSSEDSDIEDFASMTPHEIRQAKIKKKLKKVEKQKLKSKPWQLMGEAIPADQRAQSSMLGENLTFEHRNAQINEDVAKKFEAVEALLLQRVKDRAYDSVERKVRPTAKPYEYRNRKEVDQEKSKLSLAEIYEEDFKQKLAPTVEASDSPLLKDIKSRMASLFQKLDALSNNHYRPTESKIFVKFDGLQPTTSNSTIENTSQNTSENTSQDVPPSKAKTIFKTKGKFKGRNRNKEH